MPRKGENIYKRKDGRWEGRYFNGIIRNGKKKYTSVYGKAYKDVKEILVERKQEVVDKLDNKIKFEKAAYEWLKYSKLRVKSSTYSNYSFLLKKHILPYFKKMYINDLLPKEINNFISEKLLAGRLKHNSGISKKYLRDIVSVIKSIASYCEQEYQIYNKIRFVSVPQIEKKESHILEDDHYKKLKRYLMDHMNKKNLGILICMFTGIRIGELCGLRWSDYDHKNGVLYIRRTVQLISDGKGSTKLNIDIPKTVSSMRSIPLPVFLNNIIKQYEINEDFPILSENEKYLLPSEIRKYFYNLLKQLDIPHIKFHDLRHTFASKCVQMGLDIKSLSDILGHSNTSMTLNRYVHSSMKTKRDFMMKLEE